MKPEVNRAFVTYWHRLNMLGLESVDQLNAALIENLSTATNSNIALIRRRASDGTAVLYTDYCWIPAPHRAGNPPGECFRIFWSYVGPVLKGEPLHQYNEASIVGYGCHWGVPTSSGAPTLNALFPDELGNLIRERPPLPLVNLADALRRGREAFE